MRPGCCRPTSTAPVSPSRSQGELRCSTNNLCVWQVRTSSAGIVQLQYGEDGRDPMVMEGDGGDPVDFDRWALAACFRFPPAVGFHQAHALLSHATWTWTLDPGPPPTPLSPLVTKLALWPATGGAACNSQSRTEGA